MCFSMIRFVRRPRDPDRQDRRQKNGDKVDEELMGVRATCGRIPQVDESVQGEKGGAGLDCGLGFRTGCETG